MKLSILIPSIPSRWATAQKLYEHLLALSTGKDIQVIVLTDNKTMSIGEKQNHLLASATGDYVMFCHDDDWLTDLTEIYKALDHGKDVISFKAKCYNQDGSTYIVTQKLGASVEHNTGNGRYYDMTRPPWVNCCWRRELVKDIKFPDVSYSEDWEWVRQALMRCRSGLYIDKVMFEYRFNENVSEASTESNLVWNNPNMP